MPNRMNLVLALGLAFSVFAAATMGMAQSAGIALSETESNPHEQWNSAKHTD